MYPAFNECDEVSPHVYINEFHCHKAMYIM